MFCMFKKIFILSFTYLFFLPCNVSAESMTGGDYTLSGGPTSIFGGQASGGDYTVDSRSDAIGQTSTGGDYTSTAGAPTPSGDTIETPPSSGDVAGASISGGGISQGQIIIIENVVITKGVDGRIYITFTTSIPTTASITYVLPGTEQAVVLTGQSQTTQHFFSLSAEDISGEIEYLLEAWSGRNRAEGITVATFNVDQEEINIPGKEYVPDIEIILEEPDSTQVFDKKVSKDGMSPLMSFMLLILLLVILIVLLLLHRKKR